ncbi:uncharacterized protein VNE69_06236 [Vairimorpha necatrix]|uniref:Uncharacterized protein n=1 Tax=Vairimorpha necatrix TaxID=6039 RepID=A0AAX4JDI0_9MICR
MTQVSKDREFLRKFSYTEKEMKKNLNDKFSYIETFIKHKPKIQESRLKRKIRNLSTINILYSVYLSFKKIDKDFINKIEKIKTELEKREDLFPSVLDFLDNNEIIYDDLYFWHPGLKFTDIFALIIHLLPNIVNDYKKYLIRQLILGLEPKTGILNIFKKRLSKNMGDFEVIKKDLLIFKIYQDSSFCAEYEEINSVGIKRKEISKNSKKKIFKKEKIFKIVTSAYWKDEEKEEENCEEIINMIGGVEINKNYSKDIELVLCPSLSFVDVEIQGKNIVVEMNVLNDLITKNERSKEYWISEGIINEKWEFI